MWALSWSRSTRRAAGVLWRTERPHAQRGYATPVLYQPPGGKLQLIVAGSYRLSGYDAATGKEVWWIRRLPWQVKPTPVLDGDVVYFLTWSGESEPGEQENVPPFQEALAQLDTNKDGKLSKDEIVDPKVKGRFDDYLDLDDTGYLEERDWKQFQERRLGENSLRAYKLGDEGDLTERSLLWKTSKSLPNVPSPLFYRGVLYTLKEGGIFTSYDPKTGEIGKQARLQGALGTYFSSPVAADGKIYTVSEEGKAAVIRAGTQWEVIRVNDLNDGCKATPAIAGGKIYLRTDNTLYCFAEKIGDREKHSLSLSFYRGPCQAKQASPLEFVHFCMCTQPLEPARIHPGGVDRRKARGQRASAPPRDNEALLQGALVRARDC